MKVAVVGGGPAGMMAASRAAQCGHSVILLEQNTILGKKMRITGKGRCNITNAGDDILANITRNPRFLYSALHGFSNYDAIDFFESIGVKTKVERGGRVFPENDSAPSVVEAFSGHLKSLGVKCLSVRAKKPIVEGGAIVGIADDKNRIFKCDALILATGGVSYPRTGSKGDGLKMAKLLGHTITPLRPSLVPLAADEKICRPLMGLSLKNIGFKISDGKKTLYEDFGEMIFTHFGISGPVVLSASCHIKNPKGLFAVLDLKPALDFETLDKRLIRDLNEFSRKDFINSLDKLLPHALFETVVSMANIDGRKKSSEITKEERRAFSGVLKNFTVEINGFRPIEEAIVTEGGVCTDEINPKTMESKIIKGLYFAGEMIDVSAYTGGYNLQIAYSTGYAAGNSIG